MSQVKQADPITKGLQGFLLGAGTMSAIEALRMLHKIHQTNVSKPSLEEINISRNNANPGEVPEDMSKESSVKKAEETLLDTFMKSIHGAGGAVSDFFGRTSEPVFNYVSDVFTDNASLLGGGLLGALGTAEAFDTLQKSQAKKDTDRLKEYYYSRLIDFEEKGDNKAKTERTPVMRKQAMTIPELLVSGAIFGVPAASFYLVKKYMDENFPGTKRPRANPGKDPRSQVSRVKRVDNDEDNDPAIKLFDGIGKAANLKPSAERAWQTSHLIRLCMSTKEASKSIVPDVLKSIADGGRQELHELALKGDMGSFIDHAEKRASACSEPISTQKQYLATEVAGADQAIRGMMMPIVCAELSEQFPTSVKLATTVHPSLVSYALAAAKAETLAQEEKLFPALDEKQASISERKPITLSQFIDSADKYLV